VSARRRRTAPARGLRCRGTGRHGWPRRRHRAGPGQASLDLLAPFGRLVAYGDLGRDPDWRVDAWDLWKRNKTLAGFNIGDLARRDPSRLGDHLTRALAELADGRLRQEQPAVVPATDVADVHRRFEAGETSGKTVLRFA
jgi:NADPH2:quinone reductase